MDYFGKEQRLLLLDKIWRKELKLSVGRCGSLVWRKVKFEVSESLGRMRKKVYAGVSFK